MCLSFFMSENMLKINEKKIKIKSYTQFKRNTKKLSTKSVKHVCFVTKMIKIAEYTIRSKGLKIAYICNLNFMYFFPRK